MQANEAKIARRVGYAVRQHRQARGWSQAVLAEKLEVSVDYIGLLERGERLPALGNLVALADVLDVTPNELLVGMQDGSAWDEQALALLRGVPSHVQPVVLAMLRAAAGLASERDAPVKSTLRKGRRPLAP
jgi:transcriptional regulator with XRE-family HTH domain